MDYEDYLKTPDWRKKKNERLVFDNWRCGICHEQLTDSYETHHINYSRLGNENVEKDIVSICRGCHSSFHNLWIKNNKWESTPYTHWKDYSLQDTVVFCFEYLHEDILLGGEYNLCSLDTITGFIDKYFIDHNITEPVRICEEDIRMYVRNKRYEMYFADCEKDGFNLETWLDGKYGPKGGKGGNKIRSEARSFFTRHKPTAMKRIYKENDNINILMKEVRKYAETKRI